jgi:hypothetical protein
MLWSPKQSNTQTCSNPFSFSIQERPSCRASATDTLDMMMIAATTVHFHATVRCRQRKLKTEQMEYGQAHPRIDPLLAFNTTCTGTTLP